MRTTLRTVAVALVVVGTAAPVLAGQARPRSAPPSQPMSQPSGGSQAGRGPSQPQAQRREAPAPPPSSMPQQDRRQDDRGRNDTRNDPRFDPRNDSRSAPSRQAVPAPRNRYIDLNRDGRDDNRNGSRYDSRNDARYDTRYDSRDYRYDSRYDYRGPRIVIAPRQPVRFSRPWYTFLPQLRLSIGITVGRPIAFPSWYDPYVVGRPGYEAPYMAYGGVSFDVEPRDAELWIDGEYVGRVSDYSPYDAPLVLTAGRHFVDLRGRYYNPLSFEITVLPGQVIPYSGTLPYYR